MEALTAQDPARIGPFRLVARLGRGGMGRVYLGREESSGRHAAVKTIHGELAADPEFRARFTQEVNAALRVRDEFIAEVVAADPAAAVPWMATAYVPGISVEDAVRKYGPLPADSVRVLGMCVGRAVAAIHAVGLVHRDLKPGNVLLTAQGPKVIDFGIARGVGEEGMTKTGMVAGSPPYMAPEQLITGEFGSSSDVFSFGAILHYAATSAGPYGRGGAQELYARALAVGPQVAPDLPDTISGPIAAALSKDPAARPSAAGIVQALESEPGETPVPGWLPGNVTQEILTQATEALNTASAVFESMPHTGNGMNLGMGPGPGMGPGMGPGSGPNMPMNGPGFAPPFPQQSGPPSNPSNPSFPSFGPPPGSNPNNQFGPPPGSNPNNQFGPPPGSNPNNQFGPPGSNPNNQFGPPQGFAPQPPQSFPNAPRPQNSFPYPQQGVMAGQQSNGMGTAGLVLGIIGLIFPCLLVLGVIFSAIGISKANNERLSGGTSKAGLAISLIGIVGWVVLIIAIAQNASNS